MLTPKSPINPSQDRPIRAESDFEHDPTYFLRRASWGASGISSAAGWTFGSHSAWVGAAGGGALAAPKGGIPS
jgi:hypothetical protein